MPKVTTNPIGTGTGTNTLIDANFAAVVAAIENTLSRDGTSPNTMSADLDMNSNDILNANIVGATSILVDGSNISEILGALQGFDTLYLGAKAADPTLDNNGNALVDGAIYYNTVDTQLKVYDTGTGLWGAVAIPAEVTAAQVAFDGRIERDGTVTSGPLLNAVVANYSHVWNPDGTVNIMVDWSHNDGGTQMDDWHGHLVRWRTTLTDTDVTGDTNGDGITTNLVGFETSTAESGQVWLGKDVTYFTLPNQDPNRYFTMAVSAYKWVDPDINPRGFVESSVRVSNRAGEKPYSPLRTSPTNTTSPTYDSVFGQPRLSLKDITATATEINTACDGITSTAAELNRLDGTILEVQENLGIYCGYVDGAATAEVVPSGWSVANTGAGAYTVTHNLGLSTPLSDMIITANCGAGSIDRIIHISPATNSFDVTVYDVTANAQIDTPFHFQCIKRV